jgi:hypothetical protein
VEAVLGIIGLAIGVEYSVASSSFSGSSLNLESDINERGLSPLGDELRSVILELRLSEGFYLSVFS